MINPNPPRTWVTGETVTAALLNQEIRDRANQRGMDVLSEQILGSSAAQIDFVQIPQGYQHLKVTFQGGSASTATVSLSIQLGLNTSTTPAPSTGASYDYVAISGSGSTPTGFDAVGATRGVIGGLLSSTAPAGYQSIVEVDIHNYKSTSYKHYVGRALTGWGALSTGNATLFQVGGVWRSTAPLYQVRILPVAGQIAAGAIATLYGLRSTSTSS